VAEYSIRYNILSFEYLLPFGLDIKLISKLLFAWICRLGLINVLSAPTLSVYITREEGWCWLACITKIGSATHLNILEQHLFLLLRANFKEVIDKERMPQTLEWSLQTFKDTLKTEENSWQWYIIINHYLWVGGPWCGVYALRSCI